MGGKEVELPVQKISADDSAWQRAKEWFYSGSVPDNAVWLNGQPVDPKAWAEYNAQMRDLATPTGAATKGLAHVLAPLQGAVPEGIAANAALQGGFGALNAYANDTEHKGSSALGGAAIGSMIGAGSSMLGKGLQRVVMDRFKPPAVPIAERPANTPWSEELEKLREEIIKGVKPEDLGRLKMGMKRGTTGVVDMAAMAKPYAGKDATQVATQGPFPPIDIHVDPTSTGLAWWLKDGRHRLQNALDQGAHGIKANVSRYGEAGPELIYSGPLPLIRPTPAPVARSVPMVSSDVRNALAGSALMSAVQTRQAMRDKPND